MNIDYTIELLKKLISTPSFSGKEDKTALLLEDFFSSKKIEYSRKKIISGQKISFSTIINQQSYSIRITIQLSPVRNIDLILFHQSKKMEQYSD